MASRQPRIAIVGAGIGGLTLWRALRRPRPGGRRLRAGPRTGGDRRGGGFVGQCDPRTAAARAAGRGRGRLDRTDRTHLPERPERRADRRPPRPAGGRLSAGSALPYCGIHRADLQRALGAGVDRNRLHLGRRLVGLAERDEVVTLAFADGPPAQADIVIAADGVRSVARRFVAGDDELLYSRTSGFRGIVPVAVSRRFRTRRRSSSGWGRRPTSPLRHRRRRRARQLPCGGRGPRDSARPEKGLTDRAPRRRSRRSRRIRR